MASHKIAEDFPLENLKTAESKETGPGAVILLQAVAAISAKMEGQEVVEEAVNQISQLMDLESCSIMRWNKGEKRLELWARHIDGELDRDKQDKLFPLDVYPLLNKVLQTQEISQLNSEDQDLSGPERKLLVDAKLKSILILPLTAQEDVIGLIEVCSFTRPVIYNEEEVARLQLFASQIGMAVERAELLAATNRRAAELESLRQASLALTASLDLEEVLQAILKSALHLSQEALDAHVFLYDGANDEITFGAALWADGQQNTVWSSPRKNGLTYRVARNAQIIAVPSFRDHELYKGVDVDQKGWNGAIIGLPLRSGDTVVGVMNVAYEIPREFSENDLNILQLLADQAALAIRNAHLHDLVTQESLTDALTKINNRRAFERRLDEECRRSSRYQRPFVLMLLDLNNFKNVNDTHGHAEGDKALLGVAQCISQNVRDTDFVARIGGDEFALILPESDEEDADRIRKKLEDAVRDCSCIWTDDYRPLGITFSIGYAHYPVHASDSTSLYKTADKFLYQSKQDNKIK